LGDDLALDPPPTQSCLNLGAHPIGDAIFLAEHRDDMMEVITAPWFSLIFAAIGLILIFLALQSVKQNIG
jgi:hypothetical protein